jgi:hypothetical protein
VKKFFSACVVLLLVAAGVQGARADLTMDFDDMWDITAPHTSRITIDNSSPVYSGFSAASTFGSTNFTNPSDSTYNTIFQDYQPLGTVHYVEWTCAAPVTLAEFHLFASRDPNYDRWLRQFSQFDLKYWATDHWELIKHLDTDALYGQYDPAQPSYLAVAVSDFTPVTAQTFRYEVVQTGPGGYYDYSGPRVCELDGYASATPIPGAIWLLGSGLLGLASIRRFKK